MSKIEIPTECPSCKAALELVNDQLFCRNSQCSAQQKKIVEHFCKTLKIKGMGPASIEKLNITDIVEIYEQRLDEMEYLLGSSKVAEKLLAEIEKSKQASLNDLLPAFGIPLIGKSATEKLCKVITHIRGISEHYCREAGLGPKQTESLITWYEGEFASMKDSLPFTFEVENTVQQDIKGIVCISGKLSSYGTKAKAQKALEEAGYQVKASVTKDTDYLINESGIASTKTKKAEQLGITIINNTNDLIGN